MILVMRSDGFLYLGDYSSTASINDAHRFDSVEEAKKVSDKQSTKFQKCRVIEVTELYVSE